MNETNNTVIPDVDRNFTQVLEDVGYKLDVHVDEDGVLVSPTADELTNANPGLGSGGGGGGPALPTALHLDASVLPPVNITRLNKYAGWSMGMRCSFNGQHYAFVSDVGAAVSQGGDGGAVWRTRSFDGEAWENAVKVYTASYGVLTDYMTSIGVQSKTLTITAIGTNDVISCANHGLTDGQIIQFTSLGGTGAGLTAFLDYYVRDVVANVSFKVEATVGGGAVNVTSAYIASTAIAAYFWGIVDAHDTGFTDSVTGGLHNKGTSYIMRSLDNGLTWTEWIELPYGTSLSPLTGTQVISEASGLVQLGADLMGAVWGRDSYNGSSPTTGLVTWDSLSDSDGSGSTIVSYAITTARSVDAQAWSDGAGNVVVPLRYDDGTVPKVAVSTGGDLTTWTVAEIANVTGNVEGSALGIGLTPDGLDFIIVGFNRYQFGTGNGQIYFWVGKKALLLANPANATTIFGTPREIGQMEGRVSGSMSSMAGQGGFSTVTGTVPGQGDRMVLTYSSSTDSPDYENHGDTFSLTLDFLSGRLENPVVNKAMLAAVRVPDALDLPLSTKAVGIIKQNGIRLLHTYSTDNSNPNLFVGTESGNTTNVAAVANTGSGFRTLYQIATGTHNTANGYQALSGLVNGDYNTAIGSVSLAQQDANAGTALGYAAGNACISNNCTFVGSRAGEAVTTGSNNTIVGMGGIFATILTGSNNTYVGYLTLASGVAPDHESVMGADATGSGSNTVTLGRATDVTVIGTKTPASAAAAGATGMIAWDSGFIYVCIAPNTWKKVAIASW